MTSKRKPGRPKKQGLGDRVEEVFKATGIKGLVEFINGGECDGCKKRKERLNKMFPTITYNKVKGQPTKEQIEVLRKIGLDKTKYTEEEADTIEGIYNQINHTNVKLCRQCPGGAVKEWKAMFVRLQKMIE